MKATAEAIENLLAIHGMKRVWNEKNEVWVVHRLSDGAVCAGSWTFELQLEVTLEEFAERIANIANDDKSSYEWWSPARSLDDSEILKVPP